MLMAKASDTVQPDSYERPRQPCDDNSCQICVCIAVWSANGSLKNMGSLWADVSRAQLPTIGKLLLHVLARRRSLQGTCYL